MADSRDKDDLTGPGEASRYWRDRLQRYADTADGAARQWQGLDETWRSAVEGWWNAVSAEIPPDGREFLRKAVDQGKAFFDLANGAEGGEGDVLWRLPLDVWEQVTTSMLKRGPSPVSGAPLPHSRAYQQALADYTTILQRLGNDTLRKVHRAWHEQSLSGDSRGGLRELFDLYIDLGEARYQEVVSDEAFAEIAGRLINALVAVIDDRQTSVAPDAAPPDVASDRDDEPRLRERHLEAAGQRPASDILERLQALGLAPEQAMGELRAFGDKLTVALETLKEIGPIDVGASAKDAVFRDGKLTLYQYRPTVEPNNPVPVLIVYALANRPYMMDLERQRSLIRGLLDAGLEVYLIDWGYPDGGDRLLSLNDYVNRFIGGCVEEIRRRHTLERTNLLGVCQGGTFSLCYSALHPDKVANLVLMVTPVDFHTEGNLLTAWLKHVDVDRMVDTLGNIPGELLNWAFVSMKPLKLGGQKYLDMLDLFDDPEKARTFLRMEKWIHDSPAQAGEAFREFAKELFQQNKLVRRELRIGGRLVDLQEVTMPVLNVYATEDHIVPPSATRALQDAVASPDYSSYAFRGGHIGIYVSERAQRQVPPKIAAWLQERCPPGP